ncbi:CUE domain-containing protein [Mycena venus]|uniref:CUE domain-containing protein n=1 Tax=Mycena venus TaxID=2733690 RepID=A0A8H6Z2L0_9AGAR|nr:CUE domain-containing protein [Mycena venus]
MSYLVSSEKLVPVADVAAAEAHSAAAAPTTGFPLPTEAPAPVAAPDASAVTPNPAVEPAAHPRERELVADTRLRVLRGMFSDFDDSLLQSVLDSVQGNTNRAIDALLGMSDPDYQGEPVPQQVRPQTQEELDEQLARTLMLEDERQQERPEARRQGSTGAPERDTMQEFQEQFNKFAESGKRTVGTLFSKVKAKIQEFDQPVGQAQAQAHSQAQAQMPANYDPPRSAPLQQHLSRQLQVSRPWTIIQQLRAQGSNGSPSSIPLRRLYVNGIPPWGLPPNVVDRTPPDESEHKCTICAQIFSHPVSLACDNQQGHGHIFCYGCIRQAVVTSMNCPVCRTRIRAKPARMAPYEAALATLFPEQLDQSQVVWVKAWDGVDFDA